VCDIYASTRHPDADRLIIDGRFVIAAEAKGGRVSNLALAVFADGEVRVGDEVGQPGAAKPLRHYFAFEVSGRRLLGFKFGIDFTHDRGDVLAAVLCDAVRHLSDPFGRLLTDADDAVATLQTIIRGLCAQLPSAGVVRQLAEKAAAGEAFSRIVHAPVPATDGFAATVAASNQFRQRDEARAA
jgi:hypothetical protein